MNEYNDGSEMVPESDKEHLDPSVSPVNYPTAEIEFAEADEIGCTHCDYTGEVSDYRIDSEGYSELVGTKLCPECMSTVDSDND